MKNISLIDLYLQAESKFGINNLIKYLSVNRGTIERWKLLKNVPEYYLFDLYNLMGIDIEYEKFSYKQKDQFFTSDKTAKYCYDVFTEKLKELGVDDTQYTYVEPSAGKGSFYNLMPVERRIGIDIEPQIDNVIKDNYLSWLPDNDDKFIVLGNPPFGLRGNKALRFINHSSKKVGVEFVGFILPQLFNSRGRGSCMKRVQGLNLIHTVEIPNDFYYPDDSKVNVNCIFQIWARDFRNDIPEESCSDYIRIYSLSDGKESGDKRNVNMLYECDVYLPITCFGKNKMKLYKNFNDLPLRRGYGIKILRDKRNVLDVFEKIKWNEVSFPSTNNALNLRFDLIEGALIQNKIKNKRYDPFRDTGMNKIKSFLRFLLSIYLC